MALTLVVTAQSGSSPTVSHSRHSFISPQHHAIKSGSYWTCLSLHCMLERWVDWVCGWTASACHMQLADSSTYFPIRWTRHGIDLILCCFMCALLIGSPLRMYEWRVSHLRMPSRFTSNSWTMALADLVRISFWHRKLHDPSCWEMSGLTSLVVLWCCCPWVD